MSTLIGNLLKKVYEEKKIRGQTRNLREFASDLDLSAAYVCRIINGQRKISYIRSEELLKKLDLTLIERQSYIAKLRREFKLIPSGNVDSIPGDFNSYRIEKQNSSVNQDRFRTISDWYHAAIFSLYSEVSTSDVSNISTRLNLEPGTILDALNRFVRIGLYSKKGTKFLRKGNFFDVDRFPSRAIREYQKQLIHKAFTAIDKAPFQSRDHSSVMLTIDQKRVPDLIKDVEDFRELLLSKYEISKSNSTLYAICVQLFPLETNVT